MNGRIGLSIAAAALLVASGPGCNEGDTLVTPTLAADGPREPVRPCPRYGQSDLRSMMPGFAVRRSVLLRSGLQEFLFARREGAGAARGAAAVPAASTWRPWLRRRPR